MRLVVLCVNLIGNCPSFLETTMHGMYMKPPEYAAVIDGPGCQAIPVKFLGCADEVRVNTVDATATPNDVTVTVYNNVELDNRPSRCEADWWHDLQFEVWTAQLLADAALLSQATVRVLIDNFDYPVIDDDLLRNYLFCPTCEIAEQPTTNIRVLVGKRYGDPPGLCPDVFFSDETRITLSVTFPAGFAATFTLLTKLNKWRYSTTPPLDCILRPGAYNPATAQVVPIVSNCSRTLEPVVAAGTPAESGLVMPKGQGVQPGGIEQGPFRT